MALPWPCPAHTLMERPKAAPVLAPWHAHVETKPRHNLLDTNTAMPSCSRQDEPSRAFRRALTARTPTQPARAHDRTLLSTITWNAVLAPLHGHTTLQTRPSTNRCPLAFCRTHSRQPQTCAHAHPTGRSWLVRRAAIVFHFRLNILAPSSPSPRPRHGRASRRARTAQGRASALPSHQSESPPFRPP
jgi:hypothetical protein